MCLFLCCSLRSTNSLTSAWPPPAGGATNDHPPPSARRQQSLEYGKRETSPDAASQLTDRGNMQGSNSAPNFQDCVGKDKSDAMHSLESPAPHSGYQGMVRSATSWTSGTTKSSPVAVVRPHELPRKNRHWSVVSPVARSVRQPPFEPSRFDGAPHSSSYVSSDSIATHLSSPHTKHSADYQNIRHVSVGSLHTGDNIPYDGQFASGKTPSPPLPPVRDGSSLRYTRIGQTHEKYPSWPVTAASQDIGCSSCRTNSWSEPTTTISSGEFATKPSKMVYQPQLKHIDEKVTSESLRRHLEENGVKTQKQMVTGEVLEAVAAHMKSDSHMKDFQMGRSYPRYDHEGVLHDSKDYTVPSPPERDITVFTATSCEPSRQWNKDTHVSPLWDAGRRPEYNLNVRPVCEDGRAPESSSPNRSTSTDTFISPLTSPTALPPEILGSRNVSVKYVMRSSKPYYNTGTQTDDLETGDVPLHHRKSPMSVVMPMPSSDRPSMKEASTSPPPPESFYDNAKITDDRGRSSRYLRDSEKPTAMDNVGVSARSKTLTTPMQYTAPSAIGATARNISQHSSPVSGSARNPPAADRTSPSKDYRATSTSSQWSPETDVTSQFSPQDDLLAQIHEHSPSQTQMLRKLSQEFYGARLQQQRSGFTFTQPHKKEPLPSSGNSHKGIAPARESISELDDVSDAVRTLAGSASDADPKSWERLQNMSLRKAYGTYDDPNHPPENVQKTMHYRSVSTSQVPQATKLKTASLPQGHKGQASLDSSSKITRRVKDFVGSLLGGTKSVDTRKIAEDARRDWEQRDMPRKVGTPSKLKRTTSEQIRPMKDRSKEKTRLKDVYARRSGDDSDPANMSYCTSSDLNRFGAVKHDHRTSDPTEASDMQKQVSVESDVFVDVPSLRPASTRRSTASNGSSEDRRNSSDPQLKKLQQQAVVSFFEVKTGKRMSSSSVESTGGEQPQPPPQTHWQVSPPEDGRKEMKKSMSHDTLQSFPRHGRSTSGSHKILREAEKMFPVADTSFEESMSPPLLDIPVGDRSGMSLSPVSSVSSPTMQQEYSPPLHPWGEDAEYRSSSQSLVFPRKVSAFYV